MNLPLHSLSRFQNPTTITEYQALITQGIEPRSAYTAKFEIFDFHVHIIVDRTEDNRALFNILWWADKVFPPDTNHKE
jgi:hypothetical protein